MINLFLKLYIQKRAQELNLPFPNNWKEILYEYKKIENVINKHIIFTDYGYTPKTLNAGSMIPHVINLTKEWAAYIVLYNNEKTKNAFLITLGHELTHKDNEFSTLGCFGVNKKFINWANEIHADFGGTQKLFNSDRNTLVNSCEYKIKYRKKDVDFPSHPSWARRKYYAKNFDFNRMLIQQIAEDVGCNNKKLIDKVCDFYIDIYLIPAIDKNI